VAGARVKFIIDVNPLALSQKAGVAYFIEGLTQALLHEAAPSEEVVLWGPDLRADPFPKSPRKTVVRGGLPHEARALLWPYFPLGGVPRDAAIYHLPFLANFAPHAHHTRLVSTIYDLAFMHFPDIAPSRDAFCRQVEYSLSQAQQSDHVITISQATKKDLIAAFAVPEKKISVIYPGSDIEPPRVDDYARRAAFEALKLPTRYVLCVGTWEPRKNLTTLLRAWAKLRPSNVTLALCGVRGWKFESTESLIDELHLRDNVLTLGYAPREAMAHLYANASALAFPTLYEGFGLPVIEAMKCGCPVLCSDTSALPEAAGNAAWLLPPRDTEAWAAALQSILSDEALRDSLRQKGLVQGAKFSWHRAAQETLAVYRALLNR
jgi:glycosyltransferase involved in cell wall biosynthesis